MTTVRINSHSLIIFKNINISRVFALFQPYNKRIDSSKDICYAGNCRCSTTVFREFLTPKLNMIYFHKE